MKIQKVEDLEIWQKALDLSKDIFVLFNDNRLKREFALRDQMVRASISVASNIAEGFDYRSNSMFLKYLRISKASLAELKTQLRILISIELIEKEKLMVILEKSEVLSAKMGKLIIYLYNNKAQS